MYLPHPHHGNFPGFRASEEPKAAGGVHGRGMHESCRRPKARAVSLYPGLANATPRRPAAEDSEKFPASLRKVPEIVEHREVIMTFFCKML